MFKNFQEMLANLHALAPSTRHPAVQGLTVTNDQRGSGVIYSTAPVYGRDELGNIDLTSGPVWLHSTVSWNWAFFTYNSDCWAWVTEAQDPNSTRVNVQTITATAKHQGCGYPDISDTQHNTSTAHASFSEGGIAVCKTGICGHGCASDPRFGSWCTKDACANG